ncbi:MAG: caspase family protein [Cyanobacteria bacterium REEB67]|nr:caspase family protein [Cyanobacteria bacterium REEB67]
MSLTLTLAGQAAPLVAGSLIAASMIAPTPALAAGNWYDNENTFFERAKRSYNSGQFDQALRELSQAIKLNPNRSDLYYWRSLSFSAIRQNGEALNDLNEAIRLDPESAVCYLNRGLIYSNEGKHEQAIADFDQALKYDVGLSEARQNRDFCMKEMAKVKVAAQSTQQQASQAAVVASGGDVLAITAAGTGTAGTGTGTAGGAAAAATSATSATSSTSTSASSVGPGKSYGYSPYVGKTNFDPKLIAMQKEQKEVEARLLREKNEAARMAAERAKAEARSHELAIKEKMMDARLEREKSKREEMESKKMAMLKTASAPEKTIKVVKGAAEAKAEVKEKEGADKNNEGGDTLEIVNRPVRDKWALIIGISDFQDKTLNLHYPAKDARDFSDFLVKEGNFAKDHVKLLVNQDATRANILSALGDKWLPHVANPDDLVLIYISSHGSSSDMDVGGINYLLAYDSQVDNLYASGLPMQDLTRVIKGRVHSDRVVLVLDACHSGAAEAGGKGLVRQGNVNADEVAQGTGQLVISSSSPSQVSWESRNYQNSVFTRCLIDALRKNGNATTLGEAFQSMRDQVQEQVLKERGVLQTPILKSRWKGSDLRLSTPASNPRVAL